MYEEKKKLILNHIKQSYFTAKCLILEAATGSVLWEKVFIEISQNSQENTCTRASFLIKNFIKKETLAQVFSCWFCEVSKNIDFTKHLETTVSLVCLN